MSDHWECLCGNERHPDGAWHPAEPLPLFSWRTIPERIRQWRRVKKWGCRCRRVKDWLPRALEADDDES
jgi:hypothetical protein